MELRYPPDYRKTYYKWVGARGDASVEVRKHGNFAPEAKVDAGMGWDSESVQMTPEEMRQFAAALEEAADELEKVTNGVG